MCTCHFPDTFHGFISVILQFGSTLESEEVHLKFTVEQGSQGVPIHSFSSIRDFSSKSPTAGGFQSSLEVIIL